MKSEVACCATSGGLTYLLRAIRKGRWPAIDYDAQDSRRCLRVLFAEFCWQGNNRLGGNSLLELFGSVILGSNCGATSWS